MSHGRVNRPPYEMGQSMTISSPQDLSLWIHWMIRGVALDLVEQYNRDCDGFMSKDLFQWLHLVDKENLKDGSEKSLILRKLLKVVSTHPTT